jgi:MHS family alpha-ketoglutarate permease-like MFS transporter
MSVHFFRPRLRVTETVIRPNNGRQMMSKANPGASESTARPRSARRELVAAMAGSVVEIYDWTVYALMAPFFAAAVFPGSDKSAQLLFAYGGFAVGFLIRPLGAAVLCRFGDRRGRRWTLTVSVGVMALASLVIAITPTANPP